MTASATTSGNVPTRDSHVSGQRAGRVGVSTGVVPETTKRCIDVCLVSLSLPVLIPLFACVALLIRADSDGPVFFRHRRYGRGGRKFSLWKFRTMRSDAREAVYDSQEPGMQHRWEWAEPMKTAADPRITRVGRLLRRTSLDELPQVWNVIRGDMSLVGPRPVPLAERRVYGRGFATYCRVRPGLTGLWQVSGRSDLPYAKRIELDRIYIETRSVRGDLRLLRRTLRAVVSRRGAY